MQRANIGLGLGLAACQKGLSVGFNTASALVHELLEARDEKRLLRLQRQLAGFKLLIVDELGYVPLSRTGAELLFEVFSQRYERGSTLVTSNLPRRLDDQILVADRPTFEPHSKISRVPAPNDGDRRYASKRGALSDMDKAAIDIAKALVRLSELTIFELPGDQ